MSRAFLGHTELLHLSLRVSKRLIELRNIHSWTEQEYRIACALQDDRLVISLHDAAFIPVILAQGSDEQQAKWVPKCHSYEVTGCYAQTELAHGNNVQGLETVARYDPASREFVISSPRVESTKWWIGGLGVLVRYPTRALQAEAGLTICFIGKPCCSCGNPPTPVTFGLNWIQIPRPPPLHRASPLLDNS